MTKYLIGATLLLGACGLSEDKFGEEFGAKYCERNNECLADAELDEIDCDAAAVDDTNDGEDIECEFDSKKAKECLDGLDTATCSEFNFLNVPAVCADVCPPATAE